MCSNINVFIKTYLITFDGQKNQKNLNFDKFSFIFVPFCGLVDPLYNAKFGLFCFNYLSYIIILWVLTYMFQKELFGHIWWPKNLEKPQFWHIFAYFYPICSLVESLYSTKFGLFCFFCLHYIILLWVLTKILHNDLFKWISWSKYSEKLQFWHIFALFSTL